MKSPRKKSAVQSRSEIKDLKAKKDPKGGYIHFQVAPAIKVGGNILPPGGIGYNGQG